MLRTRYDQVNARNVRNHEIKRKVMARRDFFRLATNQMQKFMKSEYQLDERPNNQYSAQGHGQPAPDDKGVNGGRSLRRSIGRIEDLNAKIGSGSCQDISCHKRLRRRTGMISAYLEAEKRSLEACIEREEDVEKRLIEEIYSGDSQNAEMEKKRQQFLEILHGNFRFEEREGLK